MQSLAAFVCGLIFALGLGLSGMIQPQKILGFLNLWNWDPSLLFVMMGAIGVHAPLYLWIRRRQHPVLDRQFHVPTKKEITWSLIVGSALFGAGWGLAGYCPGPGLVALTTGNIKPFVFVMTMSAALWSYSERALLFKLLKQIQKIELFGLRLNDRKTNLRTPR